MKRIFTLIVLMEILFAEVQTTKISTVERDMVQHTAMNLYKLDALAGQTIQVNIDKLNADADLYLKIGEEPSLHSYNCKSVNSDVSKDTCTIKLEKDSSLYIGVYGFRSSEYRLHTKLLAYGDKGLDTVEVTKYHDGSSVIVHPKSWNNEPTPVVFFVPGFRSSSYKDYSTLIKFIASHGCSVVYVKDNADINDKDIDTRFKKFKTIVDEYASKLNTSKIGIVGHSSGSGISFALLEKMIESKTKWGENGRFLFAIEPWFSFGMGQSNMKSIVDTNVVFLQFGERGSSSDPRISVVEYNLLTGITNSQKDYQVYSKENADHTYPEGSRPIYKMQGIAKPLDALMKYTFNSDQAAYSTALNQGSDEPYISGLVELKDIKYYGEGGCVGNHINQKKMLDKYDIDYCAIGDR